MNWDTALADLAAKVEDLEERLEAGVWEDLDAMPFAPPDVEGEMTAEQRDRAVMLLERVAICRKRLQGAMDANEAERAIMATRRHGARSYASSEVGSR